MSNQDETLLAANRLEIRTTRHDGMAGKSTWREMHIHDHPERANNRRDMETALAILSR